MTSARERSSSDRRAEHHAAKTDDPGPAPVYDLDVVLAHSPGRWSPWAIATARASGATTGPMSAEWVEALDAIEVALRPTADDLLRAGTAERAS